MTTFGNLSVMFRLAKVTSAREAIRFTSRTFAAAEPTCVALGASRCDFEVTFRRIMSACVESGHSWQFVDDLDTVRAQILSMPYDEFYKIELERMSTMEPMISLFDKIDSVPPLGKCMYVFSVSSNCRGQYQGYR